MRAGLGRTLGPANHFAVGTSASLRSRSASAVWPSRWYFQT